VIVDVGDYVEYRIVGGLQGFPGYTLGLFVEFESTHLSFGIGAFAGTITAGSEGQSGALGNGTSTGTIPSPDSNSYSICAIDCTVVGVTLRRFASPSGGAWTARLKVNGVLQDGSGGSVETLCTLDDAGSVFASTSFAVTCVPTDHVDIVIARTGSTAAFADHQLGTGIKVLPTTTGQTMICGGNNAVIPNTGTTWKWTDSEQEGGSAFMHTAPSGLRDLRFFHFYLERSVSPGGVATFTQTLTVNSHETDLAIVLAEPDRIGDQAGTAETNAGDELTVKVVNGGSPADARMHWSFALGPEETEPVTRTAKIGPLRWVHWPQRIP